MLVLALSPLGDLVPPRCRPSLLVAMRLCHLPKLQRLLSSTPRPMPEVGWGFWENVWVMALFDALQPLQARSIILDLHLFFEKGLILQAFEASPRSNRLCYTLHLNMLLHSLYRTHEGPRMVTAETIMILGFSLKMPTWPIILNIVTYAALLAAIHASVKTGVLGI